MVKHSDPVLGRTFAALANPTRRELIARLGRRRSLSVSELARPSPLSLPAIMKHLDVLEHAGLITRSKTGRTVSCQLTPAPIEAAMRWLDRHHRFWSERLDRLAALVEDAPSPSPATPASGSRAAPRRRPRKSRPRGRKLFSPHA
jgi:DNA-binding transcriptional ArsR family regulator